MGIELSKPDPSRSIEVIGAGWSRTGTSSMMIALETLLEGPVYDGAAMLAPDAGPRNKLWVEILDAKAKHDNARALKLVQQQLAGFAGCTDMPAAMCVPEIHAAYPDAKVVLVVREPNAWWASYKIIFENVKAWYLPYMAMITPNIRYFPAIHQLWKRLEDDKLVKVGRRPGDYGPHLIEMHNQEVIDLIPKEQLLVMKITDGWEPLCKFLGKPIPDKPFPNVNDAAAANAAVGKILLGMLLKWVGLSALVGAAAFLVPWRRLINSA